MSLYAPVSLPAQLYFVLIVGLPPLAMIFLPKFMINKSFAPLTAKKPD